jgi:hypothetical protein
MARRVINTEHEPVFWTMELDEGWYAYLDDDKVGPFATEDAALDAARKRGWPVEQIDAVRREQMDELEKGLLGWCRVQRKFMADALDHLNAGWTMRSSEGRDTTAEFKHGLADKIAEIDLVIADLERRT